MINSLINTLANRIGISRRILSFVFVGCTGLTTDMATFSILHVLGLDPFSARALSLAVATVVTWFLNRNITFESKNIQLANEAGRYVLVTLCAQGVSYFTFVGLMLGINNIIPQIAVMVGALAGAVFSFQGHSLFSFAAKSQQN
jgi:putative flippase GtrA